MGLSRNKVAVSEGAAGSPPFYGEKVGAQKGDDISADLLKSSTFVVQFSVTEGNRDAVTSITNSSWCR